MNFPIEKKILLLVKKVEIYASENSYDFYKN